MDTDTGRLYETREAAIADGASPGRVVDVDSVDGVITVLNGPFKGRKYEVGANGQRGRRRRDLERAGK